MDGNTILVSVGQQSIFFGLSFLQGKGFPNTGTDQELMIFGERN